MEGNIGINTGIVTVGANKLNGAQFLIGLVILVIVGIVIVSNWDKISEFIKKVRTSISPQEQQPSLPTM